MKPSGIGQIYLWQGGSLWIGQAGEPTDRHAHHAVQITLALDGMVHFRTQREDAWQAYRGAVVASNYPHTFDGRGRFLAHIFVEPESHEGNILQALYGDSGIGAIPCPPLDTAVTCLHTAYHETRTATRLIQAAQAVIGELTADRQPRSVVDARIIRAIDRMRKRLDGPICLDEIAASVYLSPSRFRHLFVQETGLPFRAYALWLRLGRAIEAIAAGESLTAAALPKAAYRGRWDALGVVLSEAISELALAAILDTYGISATRTHTLAPRRTVVRSRYDLWLVPRWDFQNAPTLDRVLVPDTNAALPTFAKRIEEHPHLQGEYWPKAMVHGGFAYDAVLQDMADREGRSLAAAAANNLAYPSEVLRSDDRRGVAERLFWFRPLGLGLLGLAFALWLDRQVFARRQVGKTPVLTHNASHTLE